MKKQLRVLIVEDNSSDLELLVRLFRKADYDLSYVQVQTPAQMHAALKSQAWDVVVSDYSLPEFDGLRALEQLQSMGIDTPFIAVSGNIGEETAVAMMKAGASDYVMKANLDRLVPAVEREIEQRRSRLRRRHLERALVESEIRYRQISETISDFAYAFKIARDGSFKLEWITEGLQKITGYTATDLKNLGWRWYVHPEDQAMVAEETNRVLAGELSTIVYRIVRKDGRICWLETHSRPIWDKNHGRVIRMYGAARDVTDHKQDELALVAKAREISINHDATIDSMAILAEFRDTETGDHIRRTKSYVELLLAFLGDRVPYTAEEKELLCKSVPLHDIGKVAIPDSILLKKGKLTDDEYDQMKKHTTFGCEVIRRTEKILGPNSFLTLARDIAEFHHEKWDGTGYLQGLKAEAIPLCARIMAVADVYDALVSERSYKEKIPHDEAILILKAGSGVHFDPILVQVFLDNNLAFKKLFADSAG